MSITTFVRNASAATLLLAFTGLCQGADLGGAPFGNPADTAPMPDEWVNKPINYDPGIKADLVMSLGQQTYPAFHNIIKEYAKQQNISIVLQQGTCGISHGKLLRKSIDVGVLCCPPGKNDRVPGLKFHTIGIAPIALLTHPDNPFNNLSLKDARKVFKGEYTRWNKVSALSNPGNFNKLIQPVARLHCKTRPGHWRLMLKNEDLFSPRMYEVGVIPDLISQISRNKASIGYETLFMLKVHKKSGQVKVLNIDGHHPSEYDYALKAKYPFYRTYNLTTWENKKNDHALKIVKYLTSHVAKHYKEYGFIPVNELRKAGWKFNGSELIGEPGEQHAP